MTRYILTALALGSLLAYSCNERPPVAEDPNQAKEVFLKDTVFSVPVEPEAGAERLDEISGLYGDQAEFEKRKSEIRKGMFYQLGLDPMPSLASLNPVVTGFQERDGYTIENVALEILPGVWTYGNLFRPTGRSGKLPAVMLAHGHSMQEVGERCGRFTAGQQTIAVMLARMGAVVFNFDMFAYGESGEQIGTAAHRTGLAQTINVLGCLAILEYLSSLPDVDPAKIGITGASGGGTQSFLTTALDDRIAVSVPVVQVSCYFPGGCPCESGRPIHASVTPNTNNAEIAAMAVPRPMLVVSDGGDWTSTVDRVEYPFIRRIYSMYGKEELVGNVHLPDEGHDFGPNKRTAMYDFMALHLGLDKDAVSDASGNYDESGVTPAHYETLRVFEGGIYPDHSLTSAGEVYDKLREMQGK